MKKIIFGFLSLVLCLSVYGQDRPSEAGADIASPSDNVPPKKETLTNKVKRFKDAGYKIAVLFRTPDVYVNNPTPSGPGTSTMVKPIILKASEPVCDCFPDKTDEVIAKLNAQYGTDIFEKVDLSQIPQRTALGASMDDWWNTKYKAVLNISVTNQYGLSIISGKKEVTADYKTTLSILFQEMINEKKGKMKILGQAASAVFTESYKAEVIVEEEWGISDIRENLGGPSEDELTSAFDASYNETFGKFLERLKKKK